MRDHFLSPKFRNMIGGGNLLILHGYAEIFIDGRWIHASPAYDIEACQDNGFVPVEFDGINDAKDSAYNKEGKPHIEHIKDHGHYEDFPLDYLLNYCEQWVNQIGMDWDEFTIKVKRHNIE